MPNYHGSLQDFKASAEQSPPTTYPAGFTPYPAGFTPYPPGFTPNASVPKQAGTTVRNPKMLNEDSGNVRRMQDLRSSYSDMIHYTIANNYDLLRQGLEQKEMKVIQNITSARKNVGKGPNKSKK